MVSAEVYDTVLSYNPAYQDIISLFKNNISQWQIPHNSKLAEFGAGTGNFSIELAKTFPQAQILHFDFNHGMNSFASEKVKRTGLKNLDVHTQSIDDIILKENSIQAAVCVHALYTFPQPQQALSSINNWLKPGGYGVFCDLGRVLHIPKWVKFFASNLMKNHGYLKTAEVFWKGRNVIKQNRIIRDQQLAGKYWTHSHDEFCEIVKDSGFEIISAQTCFLDDSDFVVVRKSN